MADIFISYAWSDRDIAKALADDLTTRGYSVWWDTELLGGDDYRQIILGELLAAKAAIVIWSPVSVTRPFVIDEANRAMASGKLIGTCVECFDATLLRSASGISIAMP